MSDQTPDEPSALELKAQEGLDPVNSWFEEFDDDALELAVETFHNSTSPLITVLRDFSGADPMYGLWLVRADADLRRGIGLNVGDLTAFDWRGAYDRDERPGQAAETAVSGSRWGFMIEPALEYKKSLERGHQVDQAQPGGRGLHGSADVASLGDYRRRDRDGAGRDGGGREGGRGVDR